MAANYSYSRLRLYGDCPRAFECRYIKKLPEMPSEALERGKAVHEAIAAYVKHCLKEGLLTDLEFLRDYQGTDEVREILETYADSHVINPGKYEIEEMWKLWLGNGKWLFWAVIDLLEDKGELVIIEDAKTDHALRPQSEIDKDLQLRTYAWAASMKYPKADEFRCRIDFVRHGVTRETTYTRDDIPAIEKQLIQQVETIEADKDFAPTPGSFCNLCSFTADCPWILKGGVEMVTTSEQAREATAELITLEARGKVIKDMMKPWCSTNGAVEVNGLETGFFKRESFEYPDIDVLAEALYGSGFDPSKYLKADTTKLKALTKKSVTAEEALAAIAVDKSSTTFTTRKVKA